VFAARATDAFELRDGGYAAVRGLLVLSEGETLNLRKFDLVASEGGRAGYEGGCCKQRWVEEWKEMHGRYMGMLLQ